MQPVIDFVSANPLYGAGLVLLLVLLAVGLIKRAVKLVAIAALLNVGYGYYLHDAAANAYQKAQETVEDVAGKAAAKAGGMLPLR